MIAQAFLAEITEKNYVSGEVFLTDESHSLQAAYHRTAMISKYKKHGNRNAVERVFREIKRRIICFSNASADTADDWISSLSFAWNQLI